MPSLDFKGKSFIYTHHLGVPYRELVVVPEKSEPAGATPDLDGNLIIHGDNLEALKALLPRYAGKVDCIYIDPPYNTGTEGWCYNDAVNAPLMREWLKKNANPVDREQPLRHDKWLCMMWPRLQLLKELLAEDGAIFVSIDDNEVHRLRAMMDEVFGEEQFVCAFVWQKRESPDNDEEFVTATHDYVVVYGNSRDMLEIKRLARTAEADARYDNPDDDKRGPWTSSDITRREYREHDFYPIKLPSGREVTPAAGRSWAMPRENYEALIKDNRIYFGPKGDAMPRLKRFRSEVSDGIVPVTWWSRSDVDGNDVAKREIARIFPDRPNIFQTPKPLSLIERLLLLVPDKNALILDSFAGSGTTAHAVLALNAKDGGKRRFILCETEAYADTLTAERVRRVIRGYDFTGTQETELMKPEKVTWTTFEKDKKRNELLERIEGIETLERANYDKIEKKIVDGVLTVVGKRTIKDKMPGLGGSFAYVELGESMDLERLLAETPGTLPGFAALARYLFHTATGHTLATAADRLAPGDAPVFIGETALVRVYLHYRPEEEWLRSPASAFTRAQAEAIATESKGSGKQVLVFAAAKYISHRSLRDLSDAAKVRVDFAQLPYALHRVQAE
jgi:adenine-specific DNA-methyltransferase